MSTDHEVATAKLQRRLDRARQENEILEQLIEEKTRSLFLVQNDLRQSMDYLQNVLDSMQSSLIVADGAGRITSVGGTTSAVTGRSAHELVGTPASCLIAMEGSNTGGPSSSPGEPQQAEMAVLDGPAVPVLVTSSYLRDDHGETRGTVWIATDLSERRQLEVELRHAQRMEAIGQLAAGVAHEINTPIQFIGDSINFIGDVFGDLQSLLESYRKLAADLTDDQHREALTKIAELEEEIDLDFVNEEAPKAVQRTLDGIARVSSIVAAMKQFSHPGGDDLAPGDVNEIIRNTLVVAASEYKFVAEIQLDLGPIPEVMCDRGDLGQVFINLVVNASHAIGDHPQPNGGLGRITIASSVDNDGVTVTIADTGGGIPHEIHDRVFEPFFTTKEVGKGTGHGLSLAHNVVVGKHAGRIDFDVEQGVGTTFTVWLPRQAAP